MTGLNDTKPAPALVRLVKLAREKRGAGLLVDVRPRNVDGSCKWMHQNDPEYAHLQEVKFIKFGGRKMLYWSWRRAGDQGVDYSSLSMNLATDYYLALADPK